MYYDNNHNNYDYCNPSILILFVLGNGYLEYKVAVLAAWCFPSRLQLLQESLECSGPPEKNAYIYLMIAQCHRENNSISDALKSAKQALEAASRLEDLAMQADASRYSVIILLVIWRLYYCFFLCTDYVLWAFLHCTDA